MARIATQRALNGQELRRSICAARWEINELVSCVAIANMSVTWRWLYVLVDMCDDAPVCPSTHPAQISYELVCAYWPGLAMHPPSLGRAMEKL